MKKGLLTIFSICMLFLAVVSAATFAKRISMEYNDLDRHYDPVTQIVYNGHSVVYYGFAAIVFTAITLVCIAGLIRMFRK